MVQPPTCGDKPAVDQIGRQMDGDERELEAAGEEAEHQQHVAAVAERFRQRLPQRLRCGALGRRASAGVASASDNGRISSIRPPKISSAFCQPKLSIKRDAPAAKRGTGRRSRRPCRRRTPTSASRSGSSLPKRRQHDAEGAAGEAEADEDAGRKIEHERRGRICHHDEADGVEDCADATAPGSTPNGRRARRRTAGRAPQRFLNRDREARIRRGPSRSPATAASERIRAPSAARS